jgi:hypothetical protein
MRCFGAAAALCALAFWSMPTAALAQRIAPGEPYQPQVLQQPQDQQQQEPLQADAPEIARRADRPASPRYFIEFRSRTALSYGHTFVVFGRVGQKLTANNVAGLHPRGDSSITYMLGHILMVPAETGASDGDLEEQYMTASYRLMLTAAQYRTVVAHIRELQANSPTWNAATYNCNAFAGTIAHFVGLTSPPTWLLPEDFINSMRRMNDDRRYAVLPRPNGAAEASAAMARHLPAKR